MVFSNKIKFYWLNKNEISIYVDKELFDSTEKEKQFLKKVLKIFELNNLEGIFSSDCVFDLKELENYFSDIKIIRNNKVLGSLYSVSVNKECINEVVDFLLDADCTFEGTGFANDKKMTIVLNDHDGSCFNVDKNLFDIDFYKKELEKLI